MTDEDWEATFTEVQLRQEKERTRQRELDVEWKKLDIQNRKDRRTQWSEVFGWIVGSILVTIIILSIIFAMYRSAQDNARKATAREEKELVQTEACRDLESEIDQRTCLISLGLNGP